MWLSQKTEQEKEKENSRALERKRLRKVARLLGEKRRFRKGKSSKGDLYFGKGVASAWTLSVLSTTVRYGTVQ